MGFVASLKREGLDNENKQKKIHAKGFCNVFGLGFSSKAD